MKKPSIALLLTLCLPLFAGPKIMTVSGPIEADELGRALTHEHILVDFIGAEQISPERWDKNKVAAAMLPYLLQLKDHGGRSFFECTPAYLGRDPILLKRLSQQSGLHLITNTGYYGARQNRFLPQHAFTESAEQIAARWINESENGIEDTGIKPGFIKIGVDRGPLSELHAKLVTAAAKAHLATGLTIASHTGTAQPALEQIALLKAQGVSPSAFIWVHAQAEQDQELHLQAARQGAWISLDGIRAQNITPLVEQIENLRSHDLLDHVLLSHDAGWYRPQETDPAVKVRPYTALFEQLLPRLSEKGYSEGEIGQLLVQNPAKAFAIRVRRR